MYIVTYEQYGKYISSITEITVECQSYSEAVDLAKKLNKSVYIGNVLIIDLNARSNNSGSFMGRTSYYFRD